MPVRILLTAMLLCGVGLAEEAPVYIPQFGHGTDNFGNSFSTTISFINLANTTNRTTIRVFAPDGSPVDLLERVASPFEPGGAVAEAGTEVAPAGFGAARSANADMSPDGIRTGWAEITAEAPVDVEVLFSIRNSMTGALTTSTSIIPTAPVTSASFIAFAEAGADTGVALLNPPVNAGSATIGVRVLNRFGEEVGREEIILAPGMQIARFLRQIVAGLENFTGTFELRSDVPVAVLPLRQEGIELTTQAVHPGREFLN